MDKRAAQRDALRRKGDVLRILGLSWSWGVQLTAQAGVRAVLKALPELLREAESSDAGAVQALPWSGLDPLAFRLFQLNVDMLYP